MKEAEIFINNFHNLGGTLLKERKKSLYLLLDSFKHLQNDEDFLGEICKKLEPKTYLEETYKLETLLYFKRSKELFNILKSGHDIASSKIIKQPWFLRSVFENFNVKNFVIVVFPQLSLVIRSKILKQILKEFKDQQLIDALFDELLQVYGLRPALILLSGCSVSKIKNILKNTGVKLSKAQLKLLHDKDPELIIFHYEEFYKRGGDMRTLLNFDYYLRRKDPNLYVKLFEKYSEITFNGLGYRTTLKYVKENKEIIIEKAEKYHSMGVFNNSALVKAFGNDFPKFLQQIFPKKITELPFSNVRTILNYYPKKKRYQVFYNLFQKVYNRNLLDNKEYISHDLLEIIQSQEEMDKWVEVFQNDVLYIQYKKTCQSVPELKQHIQKSDDIKYRQQLLQYLVKTCSIHDDFDKFLDVLKFFYDKLRNCDSDIITCFLDKIYENIDIEKLKENHWKYIYEIILILDIKDCLIRNTTPLLFEYCKFLYKSNKSFEEAIPIYLKCTNFELKQAEFRNEKFRDENFEKQFLKLVLKYYPQMKNIGDNLWKNTEIILRIKKWNKRHPEDQIIVSDYDFIISTLVKSLSVDNCFYLTLDCMTYLICRENRSDIFGDFYFKRLKNFKNITLTTFFLKYEPKIFEKNVDKIINLLDRHTQKSLTNYFKKYEHYGLVQVVTKHYIGILEDQEEDKLKIVKLLALIMPKKDFLQLLEKYTPTANKISLLEANSEEKKLYQIQIALAKSILFTNYQTEALPIILKYCTGDFLQPALLSLYSCFNRVPEKKLHRLIDILLTKPVSLKKHSIFLAAMVFPIELNNDIGQKIMDEKNESIQKHLFTSSYKFFLKNPLKEIWKILEKYMECLTVTEKESLNLLTKIHAFPEKYRSEFAIKSWTVFEKLSAEETSSMSSFFNEFMRNIKDDDVKFLSSDFCVKAIESRLFIEPHKINKECLNFATKFMMYGSETHNNIQGVLSVLQKYKNKYTDAKSIILTKSIIDKFFKSVFEKTMNVKDHRITLNKEFSTIFAEEWKNLFTITDTFEEYIMLDFMILKSQSEELTLYASRIIENFRNAIKLYGDLIMDLFKKVLQRSLGALLGVERYELKLMTLLAFIIKEDSSLPFCLLVIELMPCYQSDDEFKENFDFVIGKVQDQGEIVQVFLNSCYKKIHYF